MYLSGEEAFVLVGVCVWHVSACNAIS